MSKYKRDNEEKWKKCSRQICDALFDSLRSSTAKLRFGDYCGGELRAVRRYSRFNTPYLDSLKQLFVLFNWLSPQVFRPVDFIILSLFETCKPFLMMLSPSGHHSGGVRKDNLSQCEINYLLCVILVHLYLLLTNSTEDQILRRLHYLSPQIIESYGESSTFSKANKNPMTGGTSPLESQGGIILNDNHNNDESDNASTTSSTTTSGDHTNSTTSDMKRGVGGGGGGGVDASFGEGSSSFFMDDDESDFNLNESSQFLVKFLLRIVDIGFAHLERALKFDTASVYSSVSNLTSSSSASFQRDALVNTTRDLAHTQHLLVNYLLNLIYVLHSGNYPKLTSAFVYLIESKSSHHHHQNRTTTSAAAATHHNHNHHQHECGSSSNSELFNFEAASFAVRLNKIVLFKISKINPFLATLWQQFLVLCNYQDPEYWLHSLDSSPSSSSSSTSGVAASGGIPLGGDLNSSAARDLDTSSCSSPYNSLTAEAANNTTATTNPAGSEEGTEKNSIASAKMLRSKIRSMSNYRDSNTVNNNSTVGTTVTTGTTNTSSRPNSALKIGENLISGNLILILDD